MFPVQTYIGGQTTLMSFEECQSQWSPLHFFLEQPDIQAIGKEEIEKGLAFFWESRNIDFLEEYILSRLDATKAHKLKESLKESKYCDLYSLICEILQTQPRQAVGKNYWQEPMDFFLKQTFHFRIPNSAHSYQGPIITCDREPNGTLHLTLKGGTRVTIGNSVEIHEVKSCRFSALIHDCFLTIKKQFSIEHRGNNKAFPPQGSYSLQSIRDSKDKAMAALFLKSSDYDGFFDLELTLGPQKKPIHLHFYYKNGPLGSRRVVKIGKQQSEKSSEVPLTFLKEGFYSTIIRHDFKKVQTAKEMISFTPQTALDRKAPAETLKKLEEEFDQLLSDFQKAPDENLIEAYLKNLLPSIKEARALNPLLVEKILKHNDLHNRLLEMRRPPVYLLHRLLDETAYWQLTGQRKHPFLHSILDLLRKSHEQNEQLKEKKAVFFFGNTGSGKSTVIAYLLGAKMAVKKNMVGEPVFEVKEAVKQMPVIGQSLSQSETLYARGYPLRENIALCDCPGFNDTRGPDFDFCANMSIDKAIAAASHIQAVVAVVPIQAFLVDRSEPLIELIEQVKERFPCAFDQTQPENQFFHLLVTKQEQVDSAIVEGIREGSRFHSLHQEEIERLSDCKEQASQEELDLRIRRIALWESLISMHEEGRVRCNHLKNIYGRDQLLKLYIPEGAEGIAKEKYIPSIQGHDIQEKFGEWLKEILETWTFALNQVFQELPNEIERAQQELTMRQQEQEVLKTCLKEKEEAKPAEPSYDEELRYQVEKKGLQSQLAIVLHQIEEKECEIRSRLAKKQKFDLMIKKEEMTIRTLIDLSLLGQKIAEHEEIQAICSAFIKIASRLGDV